MWSVLTLHCLLWRRRLGSTGLRGRLKLGVGVEDWPLFLAVIGHRWVDGLPECPLSLYGVAVSPVFARLSLCVG